MKKLLLILVAAALVTAYGSVFVVGQNEQALVLKFGEPIHVVNPQGKDEPGLHFKLPFIFNTVIKFDKRVLHLDAQPRNLIASDAQGPNNNDEAPEDPSATSEADSNTSRIIVDAFAKYKINDPLKFYQTVVSEGTLNSRLDSILDAALRESVGVYTLSELLTVKRPEIMKVVRDKVNKEMKLFGVDVVDVRIMRAELPPKNYDRVIRRMRAEREKEAREFRAQGAERALVIQSTADKEKVIIIAEAEQRAQMTRGNGDGEASRIYADAFSRDPEFYSFYRSMQAYRQTLSKDNTTMILSPDSEFLEYFGHMEGKR